MKKPVQTADIFTEMEKWAPKHYAYDWDNVGLQAGSYTKPVKKVMITLDVLEATVDEAISNHVDLIIAHHPLLFKSLKEVETDSPKGKVLQKLLNHDISVYAAHTNLDVTNGGVNDMLCDALGIQSRDILADRKSGKLFKVVVYVPQTHANDLRNALSACGAGHIGNYSHCTFQAPGQGTFMPLAGTDPYIGSMNKLEKVDELRMETIVREEELDTVIQTVIKYHPYEEPAYDIFGLANSGKTYGLGRIGQLQEPVTLNELAEHVKKSLDVSNVRITGNETKQIKRIAVLGGSGEDYCKEAFNQGADAYITGDMTFHAAQDAGELGLSIIDPGHYVEKIMKNGVQKYLQEHLPNADIDIITSSVDTEPFGFR